MKELNYLPNNLYVCPSSAEIYKALLHNIFLSGKGGDLISPEGQGGDSLGHGLAFQSRHGCSLALSSHLVQVQQHPAKLNTIQLGKAQHRTSFPTSLQLACIPTAHSFLGFS